MAGKRKTRQARRSREEWARLFTEQAESGQSRAAFCASRGLLLSTFANARRRLVAVDSSGVARGHDDFVALDVDVDSRPPATTHWNIELCLGSDIVLRLRSE